ncbi:hypothetical protein [Fibrella aquatilis]|uniref:Uncharacterized protein n=1 Tax=Fibrella aquatilis TaxID=2817059 RepID=A0A939G0I7_9BACT|nr:hypothetical protein [Fibrella aquatilis]MBO0929626.1 hypothetical protein [Fibrella aquatilis]
MQTIRTNFKSVYAQQPTTSFWTNLSSSVHMFIANNESAFRAFARTGAPFGESVRG